MRINSLSVAGFGPYKTPQHVDFDAFTDDGLFLIGGKTGAGKSSILDAICFALYDSVPRYEGTEKQLRSHHCDPDEPSYVTLEFTLGSTRYRVHRTPSYTRPSKRGVGKLTTQKSDAQLEVLRDGEWHGLAARPVDVAHELRNILGLTKDQFLQVILLAQNRFQQFLLAKNEERQTLLRTLFGTGRFEKYERAIVERASELAAQLGDAREQRARLAQQALNLVDDASLDGALLGHPAADGAPRDEPLHEVDLAWFERRLALLDENLLVLQSDMMAANTAVTEAEAAHRRCAELRSRQTRRNSARARLDELEQAQETVANQRVRLQSATRASAVEPLLVARDSALREQEAAVRAETAARSNWESFGEADDAGLDDTDETLTLLIDRESRTLGVLEEVGEDERALPQVLARSEELRTQVERLDLDREKSAARRTELPVLLEECRRQLTEVKVAAASVADARAGVQRTEAALGEAQEAARLSGKLEKARAGELAASQAHTAASSTLDTLLAQRLGGAAAELATALRPGEPCAVCGSEEHPNPATSGQPPVTDADLDEARERLERTRRERDEAADVARNVGEKLAAALGRAGASAEELSQRLTDAQAALDAALAAEAEVARLTARATKLTNELGDYENVDAELRQKRETLQRELASVSDRADGMRERIERHRGEHASVADRVVAVTSVLAAARELLAAIATRRAKDEQRERAEGALAEQLAQQGFSTAADAVAAHLDEAARRELEKQVRDHDDATAVANATLSDPELQDLPAELADTTEPAEALERAREHCNRVTGAHGALEQRHKQFLALLEQVRRLLSDTGELAEKHAEIASLAEAVQGRGPNTKRMRLETYVLAAQLEEIVAAANIRLRTMTAGRYELQHDDGVQYRNTQSGLGLAILDQHTGRTRATNSLSGGETFLASLALALGLAEVVTEQSGGITLDTLFVDEGFGSLDADTLEIAMSTLDSLRAGGRTIGLISHVEAMKEQIPATLTIRVTDGGASEIVQAA